MCIQVAGEDAVLLPENAVQAVASDIAGSEKDESKQKKKAKKEKKHKKEKKDKDKDKDQDDKNENRGKKRSRDEVDKDASEGFTFDAADMQGLDTGGTEESAERLYGKKRL